MDTMETVIELVSCSLVILWATFCYEVNSILISIAPLLVWWLKNYLQKEYSLKCILHIYIELQ